VLSDRFVPGLVTWGVAFRKGTAAALPRPAASVDRDRGRTYLARCANFSDKGFQPRESVLDYLSISET